MSHSINTKPTSSKTPHESKSGLSEPSFTNLTELGIICVAGIDAGTFLQGQLTCDVLNLKKPSLGACCDRKGRMLAIFWIWQSNNCYYLLLPKSLITALIQHLKKYVVIAKVKLEIYNRPYQIFGITPACVNSNSTTIIIDLQDPYKRQMIVDFDENQSKVQEQLRQSYSYVDNSLWHLFNIRAGRPWIQPQTQGLFTPQMLNLQKLGGVSFTKGCFVGQEIVARTEHLGQLKRHLYHAVVQMPTPPQVGDEIFNAQNESVGVIVESAPSSEAEFEILMVLQDSALENNNLKINKDHKISLIGKTEVI